MQFNNLEMVARDGIEPSTRGFSVRRRLRFGARKPKTGKEFLLGRPNRPPRPSLSRTETTTADRTRRRAHAGQRVASIATELFPNRVPNGAPRGVPADSSPASPNSAARGSGTWESGNLRALGPAEIGRLPGFEIARLSPYRPAAATQRGREVKKKYGYRKNGKAPRVTASPAQQAIVCRRRGGVS